MDTKVCTTCNEVKAIDEFVWRNKAEGKRHSACTPCRKECKKKSYEKHKGKAIARVMRNNEKHREWYRQIKDDLSCQECGESDNACLEFHHLDGDDKDFNVSAAPHYGKQRILDEMAKCAVLCANCHRKHHAGRLPLSS